ncbi:hypothetical protein FDK15_08185, partial [Geobacillus thermoleovorans]
LGGPDERREQKFATLVGDHFGMSPTNILLTLWRQTERTADAPKSASANCKERRKPALKKARRRCR